MRGLAAQQDSVVEDVVTRESLDTRDGNLVELYSGGPS